MSPPPPPPPWKNQRFRGAHIAWAPKKVPNALTLSDPRDWVPFIDGHFHFNTSLFFKLKVNAFPTEVKKIIKIFENFNFLKNFCHKN